MKLMDKDSQLESLNITAVADLNSNQAGLPNTMPQSMLDRRKFFRKAGMFGFGAAVSALALKGTPAKAQANSYQSADTFAEMVTAFLIAEDLATTFYYAGLTGAVMQDPNLAGPGGSATNITANGNLGNVGYLQAALIQEIEHASVFRDLLTGTPGMQANDPYTTFYFPAGTFASLTPFLTILNALENAFIGAYMNLIQELAYKSVAATTGTLTGADAKYSAKQYQYFALIAGSILGIESEHRVLGRVIGNNNPANNYSYEQTDGLTSIYHGPNSAVVALTPFLSSNGAFTEAHTLAPALANYGFVTKGITVGGSLPPE